MTAIFFPLAALLTDLLIIIMFYTKKNVKNSETKIYSFLLNINFLECLFNLIGIIAVSLKIFIKSNPFVNIMWKMWKNIIKDLQK